MTCFLLMLLSVASQASSLETPGFFTEQLPPDTNSEVMDVLRTGTSPPPQFWSLNHANPSLSEGEPHGVVFVGELQRFDRQVSLFLKDSAFLRQFHIDLVASQTPATRLQLIVRSTPLVSDWTLLQWDLPPNWCDVPVRLQITHTGRYHPLAQLDFSDAFATHPIPLSQSSGLQLLQLLVKLLCYGTLLLLPGVTTLLHLQCRLRSAPLSAPLFAPVAILLFLTGFGYVNFFLFLMHPAVGLVAVGTGMTWSLLRLTDPDLRHTFQQTLWKDASIRIALGLWLFSTLLTLCAGLMFGGGDSIAATAQSRYLESRLPDDNLLPGLLVERLFQHQPLSPFFHGWLSSDRPPLQSALLLLVRPFFTHPANDLQLVSLLLQTSMIPMLYVFLRGFGVKTRASYFVTLSAIFTSSFLLNSFYVWPKLLPITYLLITTLLLFQPGSLELGTRDRLRAILLGITSACALLTHGGSVFALIPLYVTAILWCKLPHPRLWIWMIASFLLMMLPWMLYQKLLDPPGDRLLRWHIAGVTGDAGAESGLLSLMVAQYQTLGWETWLHYKLANLRTVWGDWSIALRHWFPFQANNHFHLLRSGMFLSFVQSHLPQFPFLLLTPLLLVASQRVRSLTRPLLPLLLTSLLGLAFWILLMFSPGRTILHQGTYYLSFTFIVFFVAIVTQWKTAVGHALLTVQVLLLSWLWVLPAIPIGSDPHWLVNRVQFDAIALFAYLLLLLLALFVWPRLPILSRDPKDDANAS